MLFSAKILPDFLILNANQMYVVGAQWNCLTKDISFEYPQHVGK